MIEKGPIYSPVSGVQKPQSAKIVGDRRLETVDYTTRWSLGLKKYELKRLNNKDFRTIVYECHNLE
jgi:hypothetical protein